MAYFGALRAGLVAVPVNPGYTARELRHVLADSGAAVLIGTDGCAAAVADGRRPDLPALVPPCTPLADARPAARGRRSPAAPRRRGPRGAALHLRHRRARRRARCSRHRALAANHEQVGPDRARRSSAPDDVVLLALPLFHAYGLNTGLGAVAQHGATGVLVDRLRPGARRCDVIARHRVTVVVGVP